MLLSVRTVVVHYPNILRFLKFRVADPHHFNAYPVLFHLLRIGSPSSRCKSAATVLQNIHRSIEPPRLHCKRPRPSKAPLKLLNFLLNSAFRIRIQQTYVNLCGSGSTTLIYCNYQSYLQYIMMLYNR
jgi:hypothetical protein